MPTVWTIGHSNQPVESLVQSLVEQQIEVLVDVRRFPASRRNPQFNRDALATTLAGHGIVYRHVEALGGRREPSADSPNTALTNEAFRGYADYMASEAFARALDELLALAATKRTAIMCAEAVPWRCHRSLIADALLARGAEVQHIIGSTARPHALSPHARVEDGLPVYRALL